MVPSKHFYSLVAAGLLASRLLAPAQSPIEADHQGESAEVTNSVQTIKTDIRRDVPGTDMPYRYAFVTIGQEKYTFLVPEGYRVDNSDPTKIKLASADFSSFIVVGLAANVSANVTQLDAESLQGHILATHPNARIKSSQTMSANGQTVPAIEYLWNTDSGIVRVSRTSFITTASGLMEFSVTTSPEQFSEGLNQLNLVTLTFRTGANGKFEYVIGSKYP